MTSTPPTVCYSPAPCPRRECWKHLELVAGSSSQFPLYTQPSDVNFKKPHPYAHPVARFLLHSLERRRGRRPEPSCGCPVTTKVALVIQPEPEAHTFPASRNDVGRQDSRDPGFDDPMNPYGYTDPDKRPLPSTTCRRTVMKQRRPRWYRFRHPVSGSVAVVLASNLRMLIRIHEESLAHWCLSLHSTSAAIETLLHRRATGAVGSSGFGRHASTFDLEVAYRRKRTAT